MSTCRDVMTREPACCQPTDSLVRVAQTMKSEDVGAIPIVEGSSRQLVGMVTDRDIVVKALATGRSPDQTTVREVMTTDLVTCREDEEVTSAVSRMAERQVRRIPVVDRGGSLTGIIAQADVATRVHKDQTTGELVEAISEPGASRR
ncbi:MAG: CBS domain-containing protein [Acidobacteria bacterium]|jgi:CBS domain-containing protein|nr:CBS domain-containing protein [Acidobacteriota bacterium]